MILLSVLLSLLCGFCVAYQSPTNTALAQCTSNFQAATISFGGGVALLILASLFSDGQLALAAEAPFWELWGGLYGAFMVVMITFAVPELGIALTLTIAMLGQLVMGTIVDTFGWFLVEPAPLHFLRVAGCFIVAAGILLVYIGKRKQSEGSNPLTTRAVVIGGLTFLAGLGCAVQVPTNTALAEYTGKVEASLISFLGGFAALLLLTFIVNRGRWISIRQEKVRPWMLTGGAYGATVVFLNIVATPYIGVALVMAATMLGQLGNAILIDSLGLLRAPKIKMNMERYLGVAVIALGVTLVTLARLQS